MDKSNTPCDNFEWSIRLARMLFRISFIEIFDEARFKSGPYIMIVIMIGTTLVYIYNSCVFDISIACLCLSYSVAFVQLDITLILAFIKNFRPMVEIINCLRTIYHLNAAVTNENYMFCKYYSELSKQISQMVFAVTFLMVGALPLTAIIQTIVLDVKVPPIALYFPGVAEYNSITFPLLLAYNFTIGLISFCIHTPTVIVVCFTFTNIHLMYAIFKCQLDKFQDKLSQGGMQSRHIKLFMLEILQMHKRYVE